MTLHKIPIKKKFWMIILFSILVLITLQKDIDLFLESDFTAHMLLQHGLFFAIGIMSVLLMENILKFFASKYKQVENESSKKGMRMQVASTFLNYWKCILREVFKLNRHGVIWLAIAALLVILWHVPFLFDAASMNEEIHIFQHLSFIIAGAIAFIGLRSLGENSVIFLIFSMSGMMAISGLVFVLLTERIYLSYNLDSQIESGNYMIASSIITLLVIFPAYLIKRSMRAVKA